MVHFFPPKTRVSSLRCSALLCLPAKPAPHAHGSHATPALPPFQPADEKCSVTDGVAACALPAPAFSCVPNSCFNETSLCSADGLAATNCTGATEKCFNGTDNIGVW